jgi:hypothetical protein
LEDGYDATLHSDWLAAYDAEEEGTRSLFKDHSIVLTDHFEADDKILIRFRLFSDLGANGFGWVVDNLYIQEAPLALINDNSTQVNIYPNPIATTATLEFSATAKPSIVRVFDLEGRMVDRVQLAEGATSVIWDRQQLNAGLYLFKYEINGEMYSKKVLLK